MTGETYESQRKRALMRRSADLGLRRAPGRPVWGVHRAVSLATQKRHKQTVAILLGT